MDPEKDAQPEGATVEDTTGVDQETNIETEPTTLAEAFARVRNDNKAGATSNVDKSADSGETGTDGGSASTDDSAASDATGSDAPIGDGGDVGGSASGAGTGNQTTDFDYAKEAEALRNDLANAAINNVRQKFEKENIRTYSINDLIQRDEKSGSVSFTNPDNPRAPFNSRAEAKAWVDAMNKEIDDVFKSEARKEHARLLNEYKPVQDLYAYAPRFNKLSDPEKNIMSEMIAPYAITSSSGDVIGYSCDLMQAEKQMKAIVKSLVGMAGGAATEKPAAVVPTVPGTKPAVDTPTGSGAGSKSDEEPKNLEEAMRLLRKQQKETRK